MAKSPKRPRPEENTGQPPEFDTSSSSSQSAPGVSDHERVASRAYEIYMQRGGGDGNDMEDWFTAEREFSASGDSEAAGNLRNSDD